MQKILLCRRIVEYPSNIRKGDFFSKIRRSVWFFLRNALSSVTLGHMKILFLILFLPLTLAAQTVAVKHLTINEGLSQNYIFSIHQDTKGFLWFGTKDGLNRYDGYSFQIYRKDNADTLSLSDNTVTALHRTGDSLWIGTAAGGVLCFDQRRREFHRLQHPFADLAPLTSSQINALYATADGRLFIGTAGSGLFIYSIQHDEWKIVRSDSSSLNSLTSDHVTDITQDHDGNLWVAANGLNIIRPNGSVERLERGPEDPGMPGINRISNLYCDPLGRIWVSYRLGIDLYTGSERRRIVTATEENDHFWCGKVRRASDGTFWSTSAHHLLRIDPQTLEPQAVAEFAEQRISGGFIIDRSDNIWIGTAGWGAIMYNPRTAMFGKQPGNFLEHLFGESYGRIRHSLRRGADMSIFDPMHRGNEFRIPFRATNGDLFIASSDAHIFRIQPSGTITFHTLVPERTPDRKAYSATMFFEDSAHTVWIVRNSGITRFFDLPELHDHIPLYPDRDAAANSSGYTDISAVTVTRDGQYWFGTPSNGLLQYDPKRGTKRWHRYREFDTASVSHNHILCIVEDPHEPSRYLWVGTDGGGLDRLDRTTDQFTSFTERDGFPNNTVYGILTDERKTFWISTNKGIVNFNPATHAMRMYDVYDGLQSNEFNRKEFYRGPDGTMYFGGVSGFNAFHPEQIGMNSAAPTVVFTDLRLFNRSIPFKGDSSILRQPAEFTDSLVLNYSDNVVTFEFAALEYTASAKNRFAYMLEGFDADWILNRTSRTATYTNIDPGSYRFLVKAANGDGVWNETPTALTLIVRPPFWRTWWFLSLVVILFLSVGPIIYYIRVSELKRDQSRQQEISRLLIQSQEGERKRIAQEMHDSLGQELLVIKNRALMGLKTVPAESKEKRQLEQISEGATAILKLVRSMSHSLRPPELDRLGVTETIRAILGNVREAYGMTLNAELDEIDGLVAQENEINIIRILQESLSNIERHSGATSIDLRVVVMNGTICITVKDNGKGYSKDSVHYGIGLAGITERVRILNGSLSIESGTGSGTTVTVIIPIQPRA